MTLKSHGKVYFVDVRNENVFKLMLRATVDLTTSC